MRPPPWALAWRLLVLGLLVSARCRAVSPAEPLAAAAGSTSGKRLLLADAALPPPEAQQVHWPFELTLTTGIALALSLVVSRSRCRALAAGAAMGSRLPPRCLPQHVSS